MIIKYLSLCSLNDKKIKCLSYICKIGFHYSMWFKLSIFFSLVLFSLEMHNRSRKKLTGKKLNVDRQFFKDVICVTLLQEGVEQYQFLGKITTQFPHFHLLTPSVKWRFLYIPTTPFLWQPPSLPGHRSKLKHTGVDIKRFLVNKIFVNKTKKLFIGSPL